MHSCLSIGFSLLVYSSFLSVNGHTLNQSTVSVPFESEDNATMAASDQQPSGALITQQEKEKILLSQKIIYPFLILFGTFGNIMIIVIHKRTTLTSSMSLFFLILAVSDLVSLFVTCFKSWIKYVFGFDLTAQKDALCKLILFLLYISGVLSAWTLVAMTVQRTVCVLFPHRANVLCTVGKSKAIVVSMALFIAAMHTHLLYGLHIGMSSGQKRCVFHTHYEPFFREIWTWVDMLCFSFLPWLCLAVSNSLLVWKLRLSLREANLNLGPGQADRINDRKKKATSISITLIAVSTAFLLLTFPHVVLPNNHLHVLDHLWICAYTILVASFLLHSSDKLSTVVCQQLYQFLRLLPDWVKVQERGQTNAEMYVP